MSVDLAKKALAAAGVIQHGHHSHGHLPYPSHDPPRLHEGGWYPPGTGPFRPGPGSPQFGAAMPAESRPGVVFGGAADRSFRHDRIQDANPGTRSFSHERLYDVSVGTLERSMPHYRIQDLDPGTRSFSHERLYDVAMGGAADRSFRHDRIQDMNPGTRSFSHERLYDVSMGAADRSFPHERIRDLRPASDLVGARHALAKAGCAVGSLQRWHAVTRLASGFPTVGAAPPPPASVKNARVTLTPAQHADLARSMRAALGTVRADPRIATGPLTRAAEWHRAAGTIRDKGHSHVLALMQSVAADQKAAADLATAQAAASAVRQPSSPTGGGPSSSDAGVSASLPQPSLSASVSF